MITTRNSLKLLAAVAVSIVGNLSLGTATAHADDVLPGLTCDDLGGVITCNNTADTDYTVIQKRECAGGKKSFSDPYVGSGEKTVEPSVQFATVLCQHTTPGSGTTVATSEPTVSLFHRITRTASLSCPYGDSAR